ncbi:MAG: hypothetical protein Tsb009_08620 [Planctomycetaceae bacterium]
MSTGPKPQPLSAALSELIAKRGWGGGQAEAQLADEWKQVVGENVAKNTRVQGLSRGILNITVANAPLLSELVAFHKFDFLQQLQSLHPEWKLRDLKFRLQSRP